jgi:hypothetical protein
MTFGDALKFFGKFINLPFNTLGLGPVLAVFLASATLRHVQQIAKFKFLKL